MRLVERDYIVIRELNRWRFMLGRQIWLLCGFSSKRTCDRRLKQLTEAGYIEWQYKLYGVPRLYVITGNGKKLIGVTTKPGKVRLEQIAHDIAVLDTVIYYHLKCKVGLDKITSEKQLHGIQDFEAPRRHEPDFIFYRGDKKSCVEVELTPKNKKRMIANMQGNYLPYSQQIWIVPNDQKKIMRILQAHKKDYSNIGILPLEMVQEYVKGFG